MLKNSSILITGGTGSFGRSFVQLTLDRYNPRRLVILSRDEMKQWEKRWGTKYMLASDNSPGKRFAKEITIDGTGISVTPVPIAE